MIELRLTSAHCFARNLFRMKSLSPPQSYTPEQSASYHTVVCCYVPGLGFSLLRREDICVLVSSLESVIWES